MLSLKYVRVPAGRAAVRRGARMVHQLKSVSEFESAIAKDVTFVDFYGTFCGPCKAIAPVIEQFEKRYPTIKFNKVDIEEIPELTRKFEVRHVPTLLFFKDGQVVDKVLGANTAQIKQILDKHQ